MHRWKALSVRNNPLADSAGLSLFVKLISFSRCCLSNMPTSVKFRENVNLQQFKVIQGRRFFGTNRKRIYKFLSGWKLRVFHTALLFSAPLPIFPLEFHGDVKHQETRVMGLLCGEGCVILTSTVFDWSTRVTDGQTDRRTDGRAIAYSCRALKNAVLLFALKTQWPFWPHYGHML